MSQFIPRIPRPRCSLALCLLLVTALAACTDGSSKSGADASQAQTNSPAGSAMLSWTAPTTNTDGTALTDLAGYTILYGSSPSALNQSIAINSASANSYQITGLAAGTWYFSVVTNANDGTASAPTAPVSMTIS